MKLRLAPLPFAGFTRSIKLVARQGDLEDIPELLAGLCARHLHQVIQSLLPNQVSRVTFHPADT